MGGWGCYIKKYISSDGPWPDQDEFFKIAVDHRQWPIAFTVYFPSPAIAVAYGLIYGPH
jgi:hypothetical protein